MTVFIPDTKTLEVDEKKSSLERFERLGVRHFEKIPRRHFKAKDQQMILFRKAGNAAQSNLDQKITNFEINIFMLSFLMKHHTQG